jgi:U5 small nuclear ribonucleoprotein component
MDEELYDEFGNYIGPQIEESEESSEHDHSEPENDEPKLEHEKMEVDEVHDFYEPGMEIVLHEDKQYYPTAEKVFGKDVQTLV